jgi:sulfite exporter TauE/SafE
MDCTSAQRLVLSNIAPVEQLTDARTHIANCAMCGGINSAAQKTIQDKISLRSKRSVWGRAFLGLLGLIQLFLALPWLFGSTMFWSTSLGADAAHLSRDGALGFMFATIAIAVAVSPRLAVFALPIALLLIILQTVTGFVDHANNDVLASFETIHMLGAVIGASIAVLSFPKRVKKKGFSPQVINGKSQ